MLRAQTHHVLGVDIGGTHITASLIDMKSKELVNGSKRRANVNSGGSAPNILQAWVETLEDVIAHSKNPVTHIGLAMPGPFDYENGISLIKNMHKYEALYEMDIRQHLAKELNLKPANVCFRNDAEAFLAGEVFCGAAMGYDKVIGITLGTGLGSATSHNGITKDVNLGSSLFLDGIAEDYISSRWFVNRYFEVTGGKVKDVKQLTKSAPTDILIQSVFDEFTDNLSAFLLKFAACEDPELVVIGGGMAGASGLFLNRLKEAFDGTEIHLAISQLGEDASMIGAASLHQHHELVTL